MSCYRLTYRNSQIFEVDVLFEARGEGSYTARIFRIEQGRRSRLIRAVNGILIDIHADTELAAATTAGGWLHALTGSDLVGLDVCEPSLPQYVVS